MSNIEKRNENHPNPFIRDRRPDHISAGTVEIESERAIATVQARCIMARKFPRDKAAAFEKIKDACKDLSLAEQAFYSFARGGNVVHGPSIRLAEELALAWGNMDVSIVELSRRAGESEMMAQAWDLETNVSSSVNFTVKHQIDTRGGSRPIDSNRDISDLTANIASRKLRGRILAVIPEAVSIMAVDACRETLARSCSSDLESKRHTAVAYFRTTYGISSTAICDVFKVDKIEYLNADNVASLRSMVRSLKTGEASIRSIFGDVAGSPSIPEVKPEPKPIAEPKPEPIAEPKPIPEPKPEPVAEVEAPRPGSVPWYRSEIERLTGETLPASVKKDQLIAMYTDAQQDRQTEIRKSATPAKTAPAPAEAPAEEKDDDFSFFDEGDL